MPKLPLRTKILLVAAVLFGLATLVKLLLEKRREPGPDVPRSSAPAELRPAPAVAPNPPPAAGP